SGVESQHGDIDAVLVESLQNLQRLFGKRVDSLSGQVEPPVVSGREEIDGPDDAKNQQRVEKGVGPVTERATLHGICEVRAVQPDAQTKQDGARAEEHPAPDPVV